LVAAARSGAQGLQVWVQVWQDNYPDLASSLGRTDQAAQPAAQPFACPGGVQWPALAEAIFRHDNLSWEWGFTPYSAASAELQQKQQLQQQLLAEQLSLAALEDLLWLALSAEPADKYATAEGPSHKFTALVCNYIRHLPEHQQPPGVVHWQEQVEASLQQLPLASQQQLLGLALRKGHTFLAKAAENRWAWRTTAGEVFHALQLHARHVQLAEVKRRSLPADALNLVAQSQSAAQLSEEQVALLLQAAVDSQQPDVLTALFALSAAQRLSYVQFSSMLDAASARKDIRSLTQLVVKAEAADALAGATPGALLRWFQAAVQLGGVDAVQVLLVAGAAEQLDAAALSVLFKQAVNQQQTALAAVLLQYMAKRDKQCQPQQPQQLQQPQQPQQPPTWLDADTVTEYLKVAIVRQCSSFMKACSIAAVKELLTDAQALSLLCCAVQGKSSAKVVALLCRLAGAQQLQPYQAAELLLLALQSDQAESARALSAGLPAATSLANAHQLLQEAAEKRIFTVKSAALQWGWALREQLKQLPWPVIEEAAHCALRETNGHSTAFQELVQLIEIVQWETTGELKDSARQWEAEAVARLVITAVQVQDADAVCFLCKREAAKRMTVASFVSLLQAVMAQQHWLLVEQLQKLRKQRPPAAEQLKALGAVLSLPAAAELIESPELAQQVLQQAMKQQLPQPLMLLLVDKLRSCCACM
jgi:hypothetical protein